MPPSRIQLAIIAVVATSFALLGNCATPPPAAMAETAAATTAAPASSAELNKANGGGNASGPRVSSASWMLWQRVAIANASAAAPPRATAAAPLSSSSPQSRWRRRALLPFANHIGLVENVTEGTLTACGMGCTELLKVGNESINLFLGTNQSVYRIGDVVFGSGERWAKDRASVSTSPEFADTVLQAYFKTREHWAQNDMDFELLADLCDKMLPQTATEEDLVIHFRNGDDVRKWNPAVRVGNCAKHFNTTHPRERSTEPKLRVRLVTVQHFGRNPSPHLFFPSADLISKGNEATKNVRHACVRAGVSLSWAGWVGG